MNIAICIPVWGRHSLTERVLDYYRELRASTEIVDLGLIVGLSEDVPYDVSDLTVAPTENEPLSAKFNNIMECAAGYDGAVIVGSDNLIHRDYFRWVAEKRPDFVELGDCYYFDQASGKMLWHWQAVLGAGKYMSRRVLERCDYRPYEENLNLNVDGGPKRFVVPGEGIHLQRVNWAIDIKTPDENMWDFRHIQARYRNTEEVEAAPVFSRFGLDVNDWR